MKRMICNSTSVLSHPCHTTASSATSYVLCLQGVMSLVNQLTADMCEEAFLQLKSGDLAYLGLASSGECTRAYLPGQTSLCEWGSPIQL